MTKTKKYKKEYMKKRGMFLLGIGIIFLIISTILEIFNLGNIQIGSMFVTKYLFTFSFIILLIGIKNYFYPSDIIYDERYFEINYKTSKTTLALTAYALIIISIIALIYPVKIDLNLITSYMIVFIMFTFIITKKIIERKY